MAMNKIPSKFSFSPSRFSISSNSSSLLYTFYNSLLRLKPLKSFITKDVFDSLSFYFFFSPLVCFIFCVFGLRLFLRLSFFLYFPVGVIGHISFLSTTTRSPLSMECYKRYGNSGRYHFLLLVLNQCYLQNS